MVTASSVHIPVLRGRGAERELLGGLLAEAAAGRGGALLLAGELGIGKSALLADAAARADGFTILRATGVDEEAHLPYAGLAGLLEPLAGQTDRLTDGHRQAVRRALRGEGCPDAERLMLRLGVLALLDSATALQPVLCCVDDVDQLDPASADVIAFTARRVSQRHTAVLLTTSAEERIAGVSRHPLTALDEADSRRVVADRLCGMPARALEAAAAHLAEIGHGNPQALVDLAASLTADQHSGKVALPERLPETSPLRHAYRSRLERLPGPTRELLLIAAAEDGIEARTLARAAHVAGLDLGALAPAELSGLVRVADGVVTFPQPLVRLTAYELAPLARRRETHRLLAGLDGDRQPIRRALHLAAASTGVDAGLSDDLAAAAAGCGSHDRAAIVLERAADLAAEPLAAARQLVAAARAAWLAGRPQRARRLLARLRQSVADLPAGADLDPILGKTDLLTGEIELRSGAAVAALDALLAAADRLAPNHRDLAVRALMRAAEAACFSGEYTRVTEVQARAETLRRPGDSLQMELVFEEIRGFAATFLGRHAEATAPLRAVVAISERLGEPGALTAASAAALLLGDDHTALRVAAKAREAADLAGDRAVLPVTLELAAYAEFWLGRYDAATQTCLAGLHAARTGGQDNYAGDHSGLLAVLAAIRGDRDRCEQRLAEMGAPAAAGRVSRPRVLGQWALGILDLSAGRPAEALTRLGSIADPATGRGHVVVQVLATPWLVEAAARCGAGQAARPAVEAFDRWACETGDPLRQALASRCRALLADRASTEAEDLFRQALDLHAAAEADFERARTHLLFGQELRRARRPRDARGHLHRALDLFHTAGAPGWADEVRAELRAAGEPVAVGPVDASAALTAQQLQIAQLVAGGATNREVAARLFISTRTVDHHMRNIFSRLGIRSRTELVRALD